MRRSIDLGGIDDPTAERLLAAYMPCVRAVARLYAKSERADLEAVGRAAILEAFLSLDREKASEGTWIRRVIHWRVTEAIQDLPEEALVGHAEVLDGHEIDRNPELGYERHLVLDAVKALSPRHATIILARLLDGDTFEQIADSLGISTQLTHVEYQRAIVELRKLVASD